MTSQMDVSLSDVRVQTVLVPLDGSELALRAMPTARVLAERFGAELHTISIAGPGDEVARMRALAAAVLGVDVRDERAHVVPGDDPAEVIAAHADELDDCLLCMATHGRGRLSGAMVGSVARSVLQRTRKALVALGPMADNPGWFPRPRSWPEPLSIPRIVACVDGSEISEQVLPLAAAWGRALGMAMSIVTVVQDAPAPLRRNRQHSRYGLGIEPKSYIDTLVKQFQGGAPDVDGVVVRDPIDPAGGIRSHLVDRPAGLVAVTTHARSGMGRVLLGAEAARIVRAVDVPCLVAPAEMSPRAAAAN
jgi:nucleotide-binding universal stress UspA family protein